MTAPRVFEGTYGSFAEVPHQTGYNSEAYLRDLLAYCEERADELVAGVFPQSLERNIQTSVLIATVAAMLGTGKLRILDFGGGLGQTFVTLAAGILNCAERLDYIVCDLPDTIAYLRAHDIYEARGINCVRFVGDLHHVERCDLVYAGASLQYVDDYRGLLRDIFALQPARILLTQTPVMIHTPTFVTAQTNVPGGLRPFRVYNGEELVALFTEGGYRLTGGGCEFDGDFHRFHNFPPECQDYRRAMLVFDRDTQLSRWRRIFQFNLTSAVGAQRP